MRVRVHVWLCVWRGRAQRACNGVFVGDSEVAVCWRGMQREASDDFESGYQARLCCAEVSNDQLAAFIVNDYARLSQRWATGYCVLVTDRFIHEGASPKDKA